MLGIEDVQKYPDSRNLQCAHHVEHFADHDQFGLGGICACKRQHLFDLAAWHYLHVGHGRTDSDFPVHAEIREKTRFLHWCSQWLIAAFLGPSIARFANQASSLPPFTVAFGSIVVLCVLVFAILPFASLPRPARSSEIEDKRPLMHIIILPGFVVAALCAMIAYGTMNLLMVSTPLAMQESELTFDQIAVVIQWHIVGMFAPSFFTGHLIHRFGVLRIMLLGIVALFASIGSGVSGDTYWHYLTGLVALGLGWNFLFVGGTTLLTEIHRPSEKGMVQGLNDFLVFSVVATTAAISGYLHFHIGWVVLNLVTIPTLIIAASAIFVLWVMQSRSSKATA